MNKVLKFQKMRKNLTPQPTKRIFEGFLRIFFHLLPFVRDISERLFQGSFRGRFDALFAVFPTTFRASFVRFAVPRFSGDFAAFCNLRKAVLHRALNRRAACLTAVFQCAFTPPSDTVFASVQDTVRGCVSTLQDIAKSKFFALRYQSLVMLFPALPMQLTI